MIVLIVFAAVAFVILLGFLGNYIFHRTMIPDIIWLLILGLLVGPIFNIIDTAMFIPLMPFVTALALIIILFEGGLHTDIYILIKESPRSLLLASLNLVLSIMATTAFTSYLFDWPLLNGMLLGAIIGGSSSPIVMYIASGLHMSDKSKTLVSIESTMTDALCVIVAIVIAEAIIVGGYSMQTVANNILGTFSIGAMIGLVYGIFWMYLLSQLKGRPFEYMLTLAALLLLYAFVESVQGSGPIAVLVFGVVLANNKAITKMLKMRMFKIHDKKVERFHREISFLVRTFFFVYLGLLINISSYMIFTLAVGLTVVLLGTRFLAVHLSTIKLNLEQTDKRIMSVMMPRGLAAAVLTQIPMSYGIGHTQIYVDMVIGVILTSIIFTTIGVTVLRREIKDHKIKDRKKAEVAKIAAQIAAQTRAKKNAKKRKK